VHPILSERRAVVAYLAAWLAASYLPASILVSPGDHRFLFALMVTLPPTLLLGVGTLPVYYLCRAVPLQPSGLGNAFRVHAVLGLVSGGAWWALIEVGADLLDSVEPAGMSNEVERRWSELVILGAILYLAAAAFYTLVSSAERARTSEKRAVAASLRAHEAQLALLKAQVHPHFLFNSLNAISALAVQDPHMARELCVQLADFLRASLAMGERRTVSLNEELRLARAYLDIERIRLGNRLTVDIKVSPPAGEVRIPALLLQPLIENAITHGIATCAEGGTLAVGAHTTPGMLVVTVTNPFDPQAPPRRGPQSGGVGLVNVSRRLSATYQGASLTTRRDVDSFISTLVLPIDREEMTDGDGTRGLAKDPHRR
jgi:two-component system, LytTR family, sensor histidine kinase AlgZ